MKMLPFLIAGLVSVAMAEDFKTLDGREYKDASVLRAEPDGIVLATNSGIAKVYFLELPNDVRERFHFDPAKAAAFAAEQNAQYEAIRKQREDTRQKQAEEIERQTEAKSWQESHVERQRQAAEDRREARSQRTSESTASRSREGFPEHTYELLQDHTMTIRGGMGGASIRLRRGERYHGRILADHAEIDLHGYSYWVPSNILLQVKE